MSYSHRPKRGIHTLTDFRVGIQTYGDLEDTRRFRTMNNLEVDKPGMLYKRDNQYKVNNTGSDIITAKKWYNANLSNNSTWLTCGINSAVDKIQLYHPTTMAWVATLESFTSSGGTCQIIPFNNTVRFANGIDRDPGIYVWNYDTDFLLGTITGITPAFTYENAQMKYPASWTYGTIVKGTTGELPDGHYYYKFVPIYDGIQEMPFEEEENTFGYTYANSGEGNTLRVPLTITKSQWNNRIKSIKVYRGYGKSNIEVSYKHVKTIDTNTSSGDTGQTQQITTMTGMSGTEVLFVDPDCDFTENKFSTTYWDGIDPGNDHEVAIKWYDSDGEQHFRNIVQRGNGWCTIEVIGDEDTHRLWLGKYTVHHYFEDNAPAGDGQGGGNEIYQGDSGSLGNNILLDNTTSPAWFDNQFNNWECGVSGGNSVTVIHNYGNLFELSGNHGKTILSHIIQVDMDNTGADFTDNGDGTVTITFTDTGYLDGALHPLDGIEKTYVNYKYGCLHNGRMFGGNVRLDPDGSTPEDHENWVTFSELEQYDIMPVSNIIPLVDQKGGAITGIISSGGYLVVFTETGVFRVNVPGIDPSGWEVDHAISNMGCTAPDSIMEAEGVIFFSNDAGAYAMTPHDFRVYELTLPIKQDFLDSGTLADTSISYDSEKRRVLCKFGTTTSTIYVLDLEYFLANESPAWTTMTYVEDATYKWQPNYFEMDENLNVFGFSRYDGTNTWFNQLYDGSGATKESMATALRSQWFSSEDMDFNTIWRRLQLVIKQTLQSVILDTEDEDITINIYLNKDESTITKTFTFNADAVNVNTSTGRVPYRNIDYLGQITELIYRLSQRATFIQFEITTSVTDTTGLEIHKIELTEDV